MAYGKIHFTMSSGWERLRLRVETKEGLDSTVTMDDTRTISCHVLDTALGKAAANVPVCLSRQLDNGDWQMVSQAKTNGDGRVSQLLQAMAFQAGIYKLRFDVAEYFEASNTTNFYPFIEIVIKCKSGQHYHVPLLLSPFGYTTYRGT